MRGVMFSLGSPHKGQLCLADMDGEMLCSEAPGFLRASFIFPPHHQQPLVSSASGLAFNQNLLSWKHFSL